MPVRRPYVGGASPFTLAPVAMNAKQILALATLFGVALSLCHGVGNGRGGARGGRSANGIDRGGRTATVQPDLLAYALDGKEAGNGVIGGQAGHGGERGNGLDGSQEGHRRAEGGGANG